MHIKEFVVIGVVELRLVSRLLRQRASEKQH
jgi:hypothetical protein